MNLELSVSKKSMSRVTGSVEELVFVVVDLDKSKKYPLNFVCLLPKRLEVGGKPSSKFLDIFGAESSAIAVRLLTGALRRENDFVVRSEIESRLKALRPLPKISAVCVCCGCVFEAKRFGRFMQKMCQRCRSKNCSV